jgi:hypothetical protein
MERRVAELKQLSDKKVEEALGLGEKLVKALSIGEELIGRVKRDLTGEVVSLAKSCEYKLNRIKEEKDSFFRSGEPEKENLRKSVPETRRSKSKQKPHNRVNEEREAEMEARSNSLNLRVKFE